MEEKYLILWEKYSTYKKNNILLKG